MGRALGLLFACLAGCGSVHSGDVARGFAADFSQVRLRLPRKTDLAPARVAEGPMSNTVRLARRYLDEHPADSMYGRYVRALLASAHLMRGETLQARKVMEGIRPRRELKLTHENSVTNAVAYAVSACRAADARVALDDLFARRMRVGEFVKRYGTFAGIELPHPDAPAYEAVVAHHVEILRDLYFSRAAGDPRNMDDTRDGRTEMNRLVGEQIYNDCAAMLVRMPHGRRAEDEWLNFLGISLIVVYGEVFSEIVPMSLSPAQKQWQLEQADGLFRHAERAAARLRGRAIYRLLPKSIQNAEMEVSGWIQTR